MKIGLFFGSFDPLHIGHKIIASYIANFSDIDKVMFVISPKSPFKKHVHLLDKNHRLNIVKISINDNSKLQVSDIEFNMPQPSYTINTLLKIKNKNPENDYVIIMGADNLKDLHKWKDHKKILDKHTIYVFPRPGFDIHEKHKNIKIIKGCPLMDISSSFIRNSIKANIDVSYLISQKGWEYINSMKFYK